MNFELKKIDLLGAITTINETTKRQYVNITIGVVGCPYEDIKTVQGAAYDFLATLTIDQASAGLQAFAIEFITEHYPNI